MTNFFVNIGTEININLSTKYNTVLLVGDKSVRRTIKMTFKLEWIFLKKKLKPLRKDYGRQNGKKMSMNKMQNAVKLWIHKIRIRKF